MNFEMMLLIVRSGGRSLDCAAIVNDRSRGDGREGYESWGKSGEVTQCCCDAQLLLSGSWDGILDGDHIAELWHLSRELVST